jgi:hypothetical protein
MAARVVLQHPKSKHILHKRKYFVTLKKTPANRNKTGNRKSFQSKGRRVSRVKKCMRRSLRGIWRKDKITRETLGRGRKRPRLKRIGNENICNE